MAVSSEIAVSEHHTQSSMTVFNEDADVEGDSRSLLPASMEDAVS